MKERQINNIIRSEQKKMKKKLKQMKINQRKESPEYFENERELRSRSENKRTSKETMESCEKKI